jgi:hypothetical protein
MTICLNKINIFFTSAIMFALSFLIKGTVLAAGLLKSETGQKVGQEVGQVQDFAGISGLTFGQTIAVILNAFFSLLAIIFIVYLIIAGYNWMTAQGEEAKVTKSKETIKQLIIGLIIILAAYAITHFVFASLDQLSY